MRCVRFIVLLLMVVGSLNWGLVGFFGYNLISDIFGGELSTGARVIFALVGLAGLWGAGCLCKSCRCKNKCDCSCRKDSCKCSCHK